MSVPAAPEPSDPSSRPSSASANPSDAPLPAPPFRSPVRPGTRKGGSAAAARRERLVQLGELASGFAHEIKNPLSTLKLNLELLQEDFAGDPETSRDRRTQRKLRILSGEVARLERILADFLDYARGSELDRELVDLGKLVQEVADFVEPELRQSKITLWTGLRSGELPQIAVDRTKIKQVLLNLLINARQAIEAEAEEDDGGSARMVRAAQGEGGEGGEGGERTLGRSAGGEVFLTLWREGRLAMIEVTDTGPGIPDEVAEQVFDVYYTTKRGGTGLGLPTVRRIIEEHGGQLTMRSEVGKGTQFLIALPIDRSV